jgi:hypothetical protein
LPHYVCPSPSKIHQKNQRKNQTHQKEKPVKPIRKNQKPKKNQQNPVSAGWVGAGGAAWTGHVVGWVAILPSLLSLFFFSTSHPLVLFILPSFRFF